MRIRLFLSTEISELKDLIDNSRFSVSLFESPVKVIQLQTTCFVHLIFENRPSPAVMNYLKANEGEKAIVLIKNSEIKYNIPALISKYKVQYIELGSIQEIVGLIDAVAQEISENDESEEVLMLQRKDENFRPNELWIKFLECIPGISNAKAAAISTVYPSFQRLLISYSKIPEEERGDMLKNISTGVIKIGKVASRKIYNYINADKPDIQL